MSRQFPVKGLADLEKYLTLLPVKLAKNGVRQGLTAGAEPIVQKARSLAPRKTGQLAKAIKKGSPKQNEDGTFSIRISVDESRDDGFLGYFFEYGIEPHLIAKHLPKRGRRGLAAAKSKGEPAGGVMKIGEDFVGGFIMHPGVRAQPFLLPALDMEAEAAVKAFAGKIAAFIEGKTGFEAPMDEAA